MSTELKAGVIGLGIMGGAFARNLAAAGVHTSGYDILETLKPEGVHHAVSPAEIAANCDIIITSLPHSKALEDALFGNSGLTSRGPRNLLVIETSTLTLATKQAAREKLAAVGIHMMDAAAPERKRKLETSPFSRAATGPILNEPGPSWHTLPVRFATPANSEPGRS
jgi:3-hydroxyisobutyrate dehydrogenase-like beta-hydroxyacid dehydrogenase